MRLQLEGKAYCSYTALCGKIGKVGIQQNKDHSVLFMLNVWASLRCSGSMTKLPKCFKNSQINHFILYPKSSKFRSARSVLRHVAHTRKTNGLCSFTGSIITTTVLLLLDLHSTNSHIQWRIQGAWLPPPVGGQKQCFYRDAWNADAV